jgi:hypothetical protein
MKSLIRLSSAALFCILFAFTVHSVAPDIPVWPAATVMLAVSIAVPKKIGILSMNGIEAREDFINVVRIFDNAFNPKFVFNKQANQWQANPNYDPMWDPVSAFRLTQQTLRMEQPMVAGSNVYNFPILNNIQNQQQQFNTEIRLAQQDTFVPTHIGFFLEYPDAENAQDATFKLLAYVNPFVSAQPVQEVAFYNGWLNIMVNNVQYTSNWDLWRHWHSPETQQTAAAGAGSPVDEFDGCQDGWYAMQPFVLMIGSQNIRISITLPQNAPNAVTAGGRLCLMMRGVLGQQSTVVN